MVKKEIVNVIVTAALNQEQDFEELRKYREIFHDSDVYGGRVAYFKIPQMIGKISIFPSGKMISVGTKSESQALKELELAQAFLVEKRFAENIKLQPKTQNLVAVVDFEKSINLEELTQNSKAIYEPEQFPGAIIRISDPFKASILVFASGKAVITGLTSSLQLEPVLEQLEKIILQGE
jgi:transcription initiation factor TFIID TATA-box-binding protein